MALHGTKALEAWCKSITASYPEVNIVNMTTSWRSGMGFCAIIHHYCPHLIDWDTLDPDNIYDNNKLAFDIAEQHLGIPSLLDPQDMLECELLDKLSILTYLSQYYQAFHSQSVQARVRKLGTLSKSSSVNSDLTDGSGGGSNTNSPRKIPTIGRLSDPCRICQKSVYILERLNIGGRIVHRTCFRCGRCGTQLSLAGYYETETGDYCCELCPDEEKREELERTSDDKKSLDVTTTLDNEKVVCKDDGASFIKVDNDSGHSSEAEGDEEQLDLGDSSEEREEDKKSFNDNTESKSIEEIPVDKNTTEDVKSAFIRDHESNIIVEKHINGDTPINKEIINNDQRFSNVKDTIIDYDLTPVNNNNIEQPNDTKLSQLEEKIDENSNNFKTLVLDSRESVEEFDKTDVDYPEDMNPFGDDEEETIENQVLSETTHTSESTPSTKCTIPDVEKDDLPQPATSASTNPFGSDIESDDEQSATADPSKVTPNLAQTSQLKFTSTPDTSLVVSASDNHKQQRKSLNPFGDGFSSDENESVGTASPSLSVRSETRGKKKRRAPLPPSSGAFSSARGSQVQLQLRTPSPSLSSPRSPIDRTPSSSGATLRPSASSYTSAEQAKRIKDENNQNRRSQILESTRNLSVASSKGYDVSGNNVGDSEHLATSDTSQSLSDSVSLMSTSTTTQSSVGTRASQSTGAFSQPHLTDKTEEGQWRKKKGPAPPRPIPPRRAVKKLHRKAINQELEDIEVKQSELERQGVKLEKSIRHICDKEDERGENRDSLGPEAEDLIIQLFDLVNEKNELFRRQTELIYMKKDNRLEEQHADLEHQIRVLMCKPETQKTEQDNRKEEMLIKKLVEVVSLRNEIVDCLEMDRLRELEEDNAIEDHMSNYAAVQPVEQISKKSLAAKFLRIKKKKKNKDADNEKDIDTSEVPEVTVTQSTPTSSQAKTKQNKKKKIIKYASKKLNITL